MKAAVYSGTRNLYPDMVTAAKTLVKHSSVDKIYFLTEDDKFPEKLPDIIENINVSGQQFFPPRCANIKTSFSYMSLLRVCYTKILPESLDRVLQLDVDTIVADDIDELWDVDLAGKWFAAVLEDKSSYKPFGPAYYNIGVAMFNLAQIREDFADDLMIYTLNTCKMPYIDQDAWNMHWLKAVQIPGRFNESFVTHTSDNPAIVHYAGIKNWQNKPGMARAEYLEEARRLAWEDVLHGKNTHRRTDL